MKARLRSHAVVAHSRRGNRDGYGAHQGEAVRQQACECADKDVSGTAGIDRCHRRGFDRGFGTVVQDQRAARAQGDDGGAHAAGAK